MHLEFGKFYAHPGDLIQRNLLVHGNFEPLTLRLVKALLQEGGMFVDVGANIGVFSIAAANAMGNLGHVLAVEPNPSICMELLENRRLNKRETSITVVNAAVGNSNRLAAFGVPFQDNQGTCREVDDSFPNRFYTYTVPLERICIELKIDRIKLLKIDTEGAENMILEGLLDSEKLLPEHIIFEYLPEHFYYRADGCDILQRLAQHGYELTNVEGNPLSDPRSVTEGNIWAKQKSTDQADRSEMGRN